MRRHVYRQKECFPDELPVQVYTYRHCPRAEEPKLNTREFWKFTLVGGAIRLKYFDRTVALEAGTLFLSRPDDLTNYELDAPVTVTNILVRSPFMAELAAAPELADVLRERPGGLRRVRATGRLRALIRRMNTELGETDRFTRAVLASLVRELAVEFLRAEDLELRRSGNAGRIAAAEAYLAAHFREKIPLAELAEHVGLSAECLRTRFRRETGKSVRAALAELRVGAALKMLRETSLPHREIRAACGFPNAEGFYTAVRRVCGRTPEQVRRGTGEARSPAGPPQERLSRASPPAKACRPQ